MTRETTTSNSLQDRAPVSEDLGGELVQSWMALQIAAHIRRTRTRRELFRVSGRDLDRMGLTRFDVETRRAM
jgi:uncharacterized protein YjiS (DUF1127 family)